MHYLLSACSLVLFAALGLVTPACYSVDLQRGQALHDEECLICHDNSVYTRADRRMQSLEQLMARVQLCQDDVGAEWNKEQLDDVVAHLNTSFYKFKKAASVAQ